ncbi:MAG: ATP-binding protein [Woeseiaceae bacterium]
MILKRIWRSVTESSLTRRLVVAQIGLLVALWLILVGYFVYDVAFVDDWYEPRQMQERADMILAVMDGLADRPAELNNALKKIDEFQRDENRERDESGIRVTMNAWFGNELVYRSPGEPGVVTTTQTNVLETSVQHGRRIRTFTRESMNSNARVVLVLPGDAAAAFVSLGRRGIVLLPLIVCMPLLLLPAWLSVRSALRPFRELSADVASKGIQDLEPLRFTARYAELRPIVRSVNGLLERLRTNISAERRFIADAAHELRTPLAAMRINVEALRERSRDERDRVLLNSIVHSGDRASRLVGQLLALMRSDADSAQFTSEVLRLDELVQERLAEIAEMARPRDVELELDLPDRPVWIRAEPDALRSLVDNIVENATKYSPQGGAVLVRLTSDGGGVELTVTDTGPGISPQHRERVFERFFRVPDQTQEGSGLGLAIVKRASERLGAMVWLEDPEDGRGLRVRVRFPAQDAKNLSA